MKDGTARHAWPCGYGIGAAHLWLPNAARGAPHPVGWLAPHSEELKPSMTKPVMANPAAAEDDEPDEEAEGEAPKPAKPAAAEADEEPEDEEPEDEAPKPAVAKPAAAEADEPDEEPEARPRSRRSRCPSARPPHCGRALAPMKLKCSIIVRLYLHWQGQCEA